MLAVQTEYRLHIRNRWGAAGFVGVGQVAPSFGEFSTDDILPCGRVGVRFRVTKESRIDLSLDYAVGKDEGALYVDVGQAF